MLISEVLRQAAPDTNRQIAKEKILQYLDIQLERASRWTTADSDMSALTIRRLIELRFWTKYVADEEKAREFIYEAGIDGRQVFELFKKAYSTANLGTVPEFPEGKRVVLNRESEEEEVLWKLSTKFVHCSSMAVIWAKDTEMSATYQHMFSFQILIYALRIIELLDSFPTTT